jgi:hypothetical protein
MTNITQMLTDRATAGARYAAALVELKASYVDLAALDNALLNLNHGVGANDRHAIGSHGFTAELVNQVPVELRHRTYALDQLGGWTDAIATAEAGYVADLAAG